MNEHVTDDDLILRTYGDAAPDEAAAVDAHLIRCARCRALRDELIETLQLANMAAAPEPGPAFERVMWARIQPALASQRPRRWLQPVVLVTAWAATVALVVGAGFAWRGRDLRPAPTPAAQALNPATASRARERVLLTALDDHFSQTEMLLVELMNAPETDAADFGFARTTADDLVASGRLYRETARQNGDRTFTEAIDDVQAVLVEVARSPETVNARDVSALRSQIDDNGLLFKVRAVSNEIRDRQHTLMTVHD